MSLVEALAGVLPAAGRDTHEVVIAELVDLGALDELEAIGWANVARSLRDDSWHATTRARAAERARTYDDALRWRLFGVAAQSDASVSDEILKAFAQDR